MRRLFVFFIINVFFSLCVVQLGAQTIVKPGMNVKHSSFAIIADEQTWKECSVELRAYQQVLEEESLPTFVVYDKWKNPEAVKKVILSLYKKHKLEGVVLVGDIPVPMIRKAQHLTSAFKMDEDIDWHESSVPSDRFYDDFHLEFDFVKKDSLHPSCFYYELGVHSPQLIRCDIYSGRIKPIANGVNKYEQIRNYLQKVVKAHRQNNCLDQFFSYTGHGSYSNSLTAWVPEAYNLREQMPGVFDKEGRARFMRYCFTPYPKNDIINMIKRSDLDLAIFHEHGLPDRQYFSDIPETSSLEEHIKQIKASRRKYVRNWTSNRNLLEKEYQKATTIYGFDSTWYGGYDNPDIILQDSLEDIRMGLSLPEVTEVSPNVRMVIFDACYNGDFREDDYIAARYIFSAGECVTTFANSVNVLQDKQANELLGLLGLGARIGQWAQLTNILESHITGDPTVRFTSFDSTVDASVLCQRPYVEAEMLSLLQSPYADIQNLALHRLYENDYEDISALLRRTFETSSLAMVRYTCFSLLEKLNDSNFQEILIPALNDSYEFIRRSAVRRMISVGKNEYLPHLVKAYIEDRHAARVVFNIALGLNVFDEEPLKEAIENVLNNSYIRNKDDVRRQLMKAYASRYASDEAILERKAKEKMRLLYVSSLRNYPIHGSVGTYLKLLQEPSESDEFKLSLLRSLAWYKYSYKRPEIMRVCNELRRNKRLLDTIRQEAERTYYRLKNN